MSLTKVLISLYLLVFFDPSLRLTNKKLRFRKTFKTSFKIPERLYEELCKNMLMTYAK